MGKWKNGNLTGGLAASERLAAGAGIDGEHGDGVLRQGVEVGKEHGALTAIHHTLQQQHQYMTTASHVHTSPSLLTDSPRRR